MPAKDPDEYADLEDVIDEFDGLRPQRHNIVFEDGWPATGWYSTRELKKMKERENSGNSSDLHIKGQNLGELISQRLMEEIDIDDIVESIIDEIDIDDIVESLKREINVDDIVNAIKEEINIDEIVDSIMDEIDVDDKVDSFKDSININMIRKEIKNSIRKEL